MQGFFETLATGLLMRGISPGLLSILMAAPPKKTVRAQLKKIYVLNESGEMAGEYILDPECPIDYNDFLRVLPEAGIGDRESLFVGEYVFTAFQSGPFVFVLLSRGQLAHEDVDWTALLLTAADSHLAASAGRTGPARPAEPGPEATRDLSEREARLNAREADFAKLEAKVKADEANLKGRQEEVDRQKARLSGLADYISEMQQGVWKAAARATRSLEMAEQIAASARSSSHEDQTRELAEARKTFDSERKALTTAKEDLAAKYREAVDRIAHLEGELKEAAANLDREKQATAEREAEQEKVRAAIESRVQELSQRFASMAKERLVMSHKPPEESPDAVKQAIEIEKAQLAKERKFLQRRAIELLDREEQVRDLATKTEEKERALRQREEQLDARGKALADREASLVTSEPKAAAATAEETRQDIEQRVKIIQQKALELLDREEKLRKRASELEAMEARLSGKVPAK